MKKSFFLIAALTLVSIFAMAQYSRYIISFKNKNGTGFNIANPSQFLSPKSIARRLRYNIAVDSTDLPIPPAYIDSIKSIANVRVLNKSNWLNQVCISTTDPAALTRINQLSFVKATAAVALRVILPADNVQKKTDRWQPATDRLSDAQSANANLLNYGNTFNQIHIHNGEYLHNQGFTGEGVTIAIFDAGFFGYKTNRIFDSVRLQNRVLGEWDFVAGEQSVNEDNTHGMYCFSTMAANRPGSMVGGSPKAKYYLYRTEDVGSEYPVEEQNWAAAAELADSLGADMISSSLGYSDFDDRSFDHSYLQRDGNTSIVTRAADLAAKKGMIVMNSAGNDGVNSGDRKFVASPADGDSVVTVGAIDANGAIASFSSWGPNGAGKRKPNIVSLGVATTIAGTDGNPGTGNGTSFANPNIAGLVACFWQAFPEYNNMAILDAVEKSSSRYSNPDNRFGYGVPDLKKAFALLVSKSFKATITNDKCVTSFQWKGKDNNAMRYDVERKNISDTGFTKVGSVAGRGASFVLNDYSFQDTIKVASGRTIRYRIKQVLPGDTVLLLLDSTVSVNGSCSGITGIKALPNPIQNNINLSFAVSQPLLKMSIALYNIRGQRLYYFEGTAQAGLFSHSIPSARLASGVYVVTVRNNRTVIYSTKVVK